MYRNHELQQEIISKEITGKMSIAKTFNNILTRFGNASDVVTNGGVEGLVVLSDEGIGTMCIFLDSLFPDLVATSSKNISLSTTTLYR